MRDCCDWWTVTAIRNSIINSANLFDSKEYTYIITGRIGPTGKTWLCNELRSNGLNAVEITELMYDIVNYNGNYNHFRLDVDNKVFVIVLNKEI